MRANLNVAFDARHLTLTVMRGMDRYTVALVRELVDLGVKVTLFHRTCEPLNLASIEHLGCSVVGLTDYSGLHWEQVVVPIALLRGKFDLYHAPAERGVPLLAPCPVVFTIHSVTGHSYYELVRSGFLPGCVKDYLGYEFRPDSHSLWNYLFRLQVARSNHILTPSDFCRNEVIQFLKVHPSKVTTTQLAVPEQFKKLSAPEIERITRLKRLGIKKPYLLYVGGYEPHKNVLGLIKTFAFVKYEHPELMLVIVGTKYVPDHLKQEALTLNLKVNVDVKFLFNLTDELTSLYDSAELFVTLSWRETFCLPALEAMTRGVPVIGSEWGAFAEVTGDAGQLIHPCHYENAAETILEALQPSKRKVLSDLARKQAEKFKWKKTAIDTLSVYETLTH
jgi:glycosyltransferase involved in cell wall biosynthesis